MSSTDEDDGPCWWSTENYMLFALSETTEDCSILHTSSVLGHPSGCILHRGEKEMFGVSLERHRQKIINHSYSAILGNDVYEITSVGIIMTESNNNNNDNNNKKIPLPILVTQFIIMNPNSPNVAFKPYLVEIPKESHEFKMPKRHSFDLLGLEWRRCCTFSTPHNDNKTTCGYYKLFPNDVPQFNGGRRMAKLNSEHRLYPSCVSHHIRSVYHVLSELPILHEKEIYKTRYRISGNYMEFLKLVQKNRLHPRNSHLYKPNYYMLSGDETCSIFDNIEPKRIGELYRLHRSKEETKQAYCLLTGGGSSNEDESDKKKKNLPSKQPPRPPDPAGSVDDTEKARAPSYYTTQTMSKENMIPKQSSTNNKKKPSYNTTQKMSKENVIPQRSTTTNKKKPSTTKKMPTSARIPRAGTAGWQLEQVVTCETYGGRFPSGESLLSFIKNNCNQGLLFAMAEYPKWNADKTFCKATYKCGCQKEASIRLIKYASSKDDNQYEVQFSKHRHHIKANNHKGNTLEIV